ncbi:Hexuronate utilization operon transcriptional repressor ExuR [Indibacter alkaliphilus LW1]|uniref:Hexuronate utilization operon transcriptional repressor ExuR n=1 Tax=Indibacter alkaliphilus (strain CCUG 57479 / KCTC 22604 / LW1) TaxID=1189612 RepID=S2DN72_INDAL|nr:LacI family DNA-binding transcriptional regulator [Indibacter alkaliphilus]EOZ98665.1 Hexuronate utilization operon transcriptional repressor ExuR [Indibacter alkaliphilus LW1]
MTEKRKLTLKDIARELGISISTASRALKEHPDIAEDTIRLVKAYAEKHHYVPNTLAVNFRKNRTFNLGLIVPELVHHFFSTVISGAIDTAKKNGYNILVSQSNDILADEVMACRTMLASSVDGLLISISNETVEGVHLKEFLEEGKPVVQFDKITDHLNTPKVIVDDFNGSYMAVKHLIGQGFRKIAHIRGRTEVKNASERAMGYKQALLDHGLELREEWVKGCKLIHEQEGYDFCKELMESKNPPDAIFCITDLVAMGVLKYLKEKSIQIPEQVGVMGFSNWKLAEIVNPGLSSVDQHGYEMGQKAVLKLIDLIKNHDVENDEIIELKTNLIIRGSTTSTKNSDKVTLQ